MSDLIGYHIGNVTSFIQAFSIDVFVIAALFAALFAYTLYHGKESIITLILSLYVALLVFIHFPYKERFLLFTETEMQHLISNALIFGVFVIVSYLAFAPLLRNRYAGHTRKRWFEALLLSAATIALLIAFSYHVLPIASLYTFGEQIAGLFAPSQLFFWWLVAPVAVLLLVGRH